MDGIQITSKTNEIYKNEIWTIKQIGVHNYYIRSFYLLYKFMGNNSKLMFFIK
jgi:hypothetical protein